MGKALSFEYSEEMLNSHQLKHNATDCEASTIWRLVTKNVKNIVALNKYGYDPPIYLLHPISGDVTVYSNLVRLLGSGQKIYGV